MTPRQLLTFWPTPVTLGLLLGLPMGIAVAQNAMETSIPMLLGWLFQPLILAHGIVPPPDTSVTQVSYWLVLLVAYYYPLAALLVALYIYLTQLYTGTKRPVWRALGLLVGSLCVTSLIADFFSPGFNVNGTTFVIPFIAFAWANALISIALGYGLASLIPRPKRSAGENPSS